MEGTELGYIKPVTHTHTHTYTQAHHFLWRVFHKWMILSCMALSSCQSLYAHWWPEYHSSRGNGFSSTHPLDTSGQQMCRAEGQIGQSVLQNSFPCLYFLGQDEIMTPDVCESKADGLAGLKKKKCKPSLRSIRWGEGGQCTENHVPDSRLDHLCCLPGSVRTVWDLLCCGSPCTTPVVLHGGHWDQVSVSFQLAN